PPPTSTHFPYTTLFRSPVRPAGAHETAPDLRRKTRQVRRSRRSMTAHETCQATTSPWLPSLAGHYLSATLTAITQAKLLPTSYRSEEHTSELQSLAYLV